MSDDLGSWKPTGTKSNNCHWDQDYREPAAERMGMYHVLAHCYYVHNTCHLYHRMIADIQGIIYCSYS